MATATHIPAKLINGQVIAAGPQIPFNTANIICCMVVAGTGIPSSNSTGVQFLTDVFSTNSEDTAIGARQNVTNVTIGYGSNGTQVNFSFGNITYAQNAGDDGLSRYGILFSQSSGAQDNVRAVIAILDLGQTVSVTNGPLTLQCPAGGLIQWTGGG